MKEALCNALEGANKRNREYREQIERLQEQLDELQNENNNLCNDIVNLNLTIENKEKQLNEANEVIKDYDGFTVELTPDGKYACNYANSAHSYLEKWGVK